MRDDILGDELGGFNWSMQLTTARAARWRDDFNAFYDQPAPTDAEAYLRRWCYGAKR